MSNSLHELRIAVDKKYAAALESLRTLEAYLNASETTPVVVRRRSAKIRNAVVQSFSTELKTVSEASLDTGLSVKQVSGVVNATDMRELFAKRHADGVTQYQYIGPPAPASELCTVELQIHGDE